MRGTIDWTRGFRQAARRAVAVELLRLHCGWGRHYAASHWIDGRLVRGHCWFCGASWQVPRDAWRGPLPAWRPGKERADEEAQG